MPAGPATSAQPPRPWSMRSRKPLRSVACCSLSRKGSPPTGGSGRPATGGSLPSAVSVIKASTHDSHTASTGPRLCQSATTERAAATPSSSSVVTTKESHSRGSPLNREPATIASPEATGAAPLAGLRPSAVATKSSREEPVRFSASASLWAVSLRVARVSPRSKSLIARELSRAACARSSCVRKAAFRKRLSNTANDVPGPTVMKISHGQSTARPTQALSHSWQAGPHAGTVGHSVSRSSW